MRIDRAQRDVVPLARMDVCGHSMPGAGGSAGGDHNGYVDRLAKMLGARQRANIANGGATACWATGSGGDGGWSWVLNNFAPPNSGDGVGGYLPHTALAVVHHGYEDLAALGSANPRAFQEALKTLISRYCTAALYDDGDASWTYGGAWSTIAPATNWTYFGGGAHYTQTVGRTATWTVPADYPGNLVCAIGLAMVPGAVGAGSSLTLGLKIDGVDQPDVVINLDKGGHADAEGGKTNGIVLRIGRADCGLGIPLSAGTHTIQLTYKSAVGAAFFIIDYAQIEADPLDGPLIVVPGSWRAPSYALFNTWAHGPSAGTDPLNDAAVVAWNTATRAALADFPGRALYADIDTALGKNAAYFAADGIHPSNRGHAIVAKSIYDLVVSSRLLTSRLRSRTSKRTLGTYDGGLWHPIGGAYGTSIGLPFQNTWAAGASQAPAYRKDLDGRVQIRGSAKQTGAGAANSTMFGFGTGLGYAPWTFYDKAEVVYDGTALAIGSMRIDASGNVFMGFNGKTNATGFNEFHNEWMGEN
jgi:hypothetical protein